MSERPQPVEPLAPYTDPATDQVLTLASHLPPAMLCQCRRAPRGQCPYCCPGCGTDTPGSEEAHDA